MAKRKVAIGIDVGSKQFHVAVGGREDVEVFENSPSGRKRLVKAIRQHRCGIVVALESTGPYGLELALDLHRVARIEVRYINPMAAKAYASRGLTRAKSDRVDARALARMAADELGVPWDPPSEHALALRALTRRIRTLIYDRTREKNRLESTRAAGVLPRVLITDIEENIVALDQRIERLRERALEFARTDATVSTNIDLLCTMKGIGDASAVEILAELGGMPKDLTAKQLVAQAGLDPRAKQSGTRDGPRSISKMGSRYLRAALHMAAINSVRWRPEVAGFHRILTEERNKPQLVAYVAVARKLLHVIHGMLKTRTAYDPDRFYQPKEVRSAA